MARILLTPFDKALIIESPHKSLDDQLRAFGVDPVRMDDVPDEDALIEAIQRTGAQLLFKRSQVPITSRLLESCPGLHAIQLCCIGDDSIDKEAAARQGVLVFNDPVSNGRSVVELAVAHTIALSRRLYETDVATHANRWDKSATGRYEVHGKRLGVVGLGNIGRQVARVAEALGMEIVFCDTRQVAQEVGLEMGWESADSLSGLFRTCDIVTVHTSAKDAWGKDNAGLLDPYLGELGADRGPGSPRVFINLARGNLHNPGALLDAVRGGIIRRAAVDVYPEEPRPGERAWHNPYADEPRITCTPHIGAATQEAQPRIAKHVGLTMEQFARFGWVRDCVFSPRLRIQVRDHLRGAVVLGVVHSVSRGTKKAIDDMIFEAEASNLGSVHDDFEVGIAYDLSVIDRPLPRDVLEGLVERAARLTGDPSAIRAIRQIIVPG